MTMKANGSIEWLPTQADFGQNTIVIEARNAAHAVTQEFIITIPNVRSVVTVPADPSQDSIVIAPASAGQLSGLTVNIPAGALQNAEDISIRVPDILPATSEPPFGPTFILDRSGSQSYFQKDVELEIPYDPNNLLPGLTEADLVAVYWDGYDWLPLASRVDTQSRRIRMTTRHFSYYSVSFKREYHNAGGLQIPNIVFYYTYETPATHFKIYFRNFLLASSGYVTHLGLAFEDAYLFYSSTPEYMSALVSNGLQSIYIPNSWYLDYTKDQWGEANLITGSIKIHPQLDFQQRQIAAAHELFHRIQHYYGGGRAHTWVDEATAAFQEDEIYPGLNLYVNKYALRREMRRFTTEPLNSVGRHHEYRSLVFYKYLKDRYGKDVVLHFWKEWGDNWAQSVYAYLVSNGYSPNDPATATYVGGKHIEALDKILKAKSLSVQEMLLDFAVANNVYAGAQAASLFYIEDALQLDWNQGRTVTINKMPANAVSLSSAIKLESSFEPPESTSSRFERLSARTYAVAWPPIVNLPALRIKYETAGGGKPPKEFYAKVYVKEAGRDPRPVGNIIDASTMGSVGSRVSNLGQYEQVIISVCNASSNGGPSQLDVRAYFNEPPTASAGPDQTVTAGTQVTLDGSQSADPDNDPLTYQWSQTSGPLVTLLGATAVQPSFAPTQPGTYVFSLVVNDGTVDSQADTVTVTVNPAPNTAPTASFNVSPSSGDTSTDFQFNASACSDNEDAASVLEVRWDWENDGTWDTSYSTQKDANHRYASAGTKTIKLEVKDTGGLSAVVTKQVTVAQAPPANTAPSVSFTVSPSSGDTTTDFQVDASGSSDNEDSLAVLEVRWDWENDGTWDTNFSTTKTSSHIYNTTGTKTIKVEVRDTGGLVATATKQVTVNQAPPGNTAPTASFTVDPVYARTDTLFQFNASACSDNEDAASVLEVRWDWENDGTWDTSYSNQKSANHQYVSTGTKTIKLEVKDTGGLIATATKDISIPLGPLTITSASPLSNGMAGIAYNYTFTYDQGFAPEWRLYSGSSLPPGLSLSSQGVLSGVPTTAGTYTLHVIAQEWTPLPGDHSKDFTLTIDPGLTITSTSPLPSGVEGRVYSISLGAVGGTPPYTWGHLTSGGSLPPGLTFISGQLSGTPTQKGTYNFTLSVIDSAQSGVLKDFSLTINEPFVLLTNSLPDGTVGTAYQQWVTASLGGAQPYVWDIKTGNLPPGVQFSTAGLLDGLPTTTGTYNFTARVTDANGLEATKDLSVTIVSVNTAPTASFTVTPSSGDTTTDFQFDASGCSDTEDAVSDLEVRWDWENDGTWDTTYSTTKTASHTFASPGTYLVKLEVKDAGVLTATISKAIAVAGTWISTAVYDPLQGVWGSSATNVYAVGFDPNYLGQGVIYHYDGASWGGVSTGISIDSALYGVWGTSATDVFACGEAVYHYDGSSWSRITGAGSYVLKAIWGSSGSDVYAVGDFNLILHYDGTSWTETITSVTELSAVWGSSDTDVFITSGSPDPNSNGAILHYDGSSWSTIPFTEGLHGVWGSSGNDVFAVGNNGTILHYDGSSWSAMTSGTTEALQGVWGTSASDVFVIEGDGSVLHYDGTSWSDIRGGIIEDESLYGVWGSSGANVFVVGIDFRAGWPGVGLILQYK